MSIQGQWKSDRSEDAAQGISWSESAAADRRGLNIQASSGTPMNFIYELKEPSNHYFFQVHVETLERGSSLSLGVVTPSKFKAGWGLNAMLYNGNLTSGNSALKTSFGPRIKEGQNAVVEYKETEKTIQVFYYVNGECVGLGFEIAKEAGASFFPCLSATGNAEIKVQTLSTAPETTPSISTPPFCGTFKFSKAINGWGEIFIPVNNPEHPRETKTVEMTIDPLQGDSYAVSAKVFNTLSTRKNVVTKTDYLSTGSASSDSTFFSIEHVASERVSSTRMMPPPPYGEVEHKLSACIEALWTIMKVSADKKTLMIFDSENDLVATCTRLEPTLDLAACTSY